MANLTYRIVGRPEGWSVEREDGSVEGAYLTKESAYEACVAAGSNAIKDGYGITIEVPERRPGEPALGAS